MADDLNSVEMPDRGYYAHVERTPDMSLGVRTIQFLNLAHSKGQPTMAIYRPLDPAMPVYVADRRWDYKPLEEFLERYRPVEDEAEIQRLDALRRVLYSD